MKATTEVAFQFDDAEQQHETVALGMWTFLATEVLLFGGLFTGYAVYREQHREAFLEGSRHLDLALGGVNTVVLIASSFTMALAVHAAEAARRRATRAFLALTALLGLAFLAVKGVEYAHKAHEGLVPGAAFRDGMPEGAQLFFGLYFTMTGMHALHMVIGVGLLAAFFAVRRFHQRAGRVEMLGLYWHLVDVVWIFLFPLLYLIGAHA